LVIGGDGVQVAFRPTEKSPAGKIQWREVKVGIFARSKQYVNQKEKTVSRIVHKRIVAIRANIDIFIEHMRLEAHKQQLSKAKTVAWISDGGNSFWKAYDTLFVKYVGILDFYHAAQYLWKFAKLWLDGRTAKSRQWFKNARRLLRQGDITSIGSAIDTQSILQNYAPDSELYKTYHNLSSYLLRHAEHLDYNHFQSLGLPLGSGAVESACKYVVQQRFKGVGMRWSYQGFDYLIALRVAWINQRFDSLFA
jgi:hypothetical protein